MSKLTGMLKDIPAFIFRHTSMIKLQREACARRMAVAIGEWPDQGLSLDDLRRAFTNLHVEDINGIDCSVADLFYSFAENHGTVKRAVQNFDSELQVYVNNWENHTLVLATGLGWLIRLMEWYPEMNAEPLLHTHPFGLLTYGLVGSGYTTDIIHVDPRDLHSRQIGEHILVRGIENRQRLWQGRRLYYPPHIVAHQIFPPETYSISLNLIVNASHQKPLGRQQCFIDPEKLTLISRD